MQRDILWVGNTNLVELTNLQHKKTGAYLNAATVTCSVINGSGNLVAGETFPKTMTYETGTNGTYSTTLSYSLDIEDGEEVTLVVTATQSQVRYERVVPMLCLKRVTDLMG